jgi:hypothetical protein
MNCQVGKATIVQGNKTLRQLLIEHGSFRRSQNIDYWVDIVAKNIKKDSNEKFVISDNRFPNECIGIEKHFPNAQVLKCRIDRFDKPPLMDHSEIAMDDYKFDFILENKGSIDEFYNSIENII